MLRSAPDEFVVLCNAGAGVADIMPVGACCRTLVGHSSVSKFAAGSIPQALALALAGQVRSVSFCKPHVCHVAALYLQAPGAARLPAWLAVKLVGMYVCRGLQILLLLPTGTYGVMRHTK